MIRYYVNKKAQANGDHEVHTAACTFLPATDNRIYLGDYATCAPAVKEAKAHYQKCNGCHFCSDDCHTS